MALREWVCSNGHETVDLITGDYPKQIKCVVCGNEAHYKFGLPAKTPGRWGDGGNINGYYDRGLGCSYTSFSQRDKICAEKGLIPLEDFGKYHLEDEAEKMKRKNEALDKIAEKYQQRLETNGGNVEDAASHAMPASACLDGSLLAECGL